MGSSRPKWVCGPGRWNLQPVPKVNLFLYNWRLWKNKFYWHSSLILMKVLSKWEFFLLCSVLFLLGNIAINLYAIASDALANKCKLHKMKFLKFFDLDLNVTHFTGKSHLVENVPKFGVRKMSGPKVTAWRRSRRGHRTGVRPGRARRKLYVRTHAWISTTH